MKKEIPDKLFFKIGEVSEITELEPYVLRYWETEFNIRPSKSKNNQRLYQRRDIEQIEKIKTLLYEEKFTIAGARKKLRERKKDGQAQLAFALPSGDGEGRKFKEALKTVRAEVELLLGELRKVPRPPAGTA